MPAPTTVARSLPLGKIQSRMARKQTLQALLSPQHLCELAGPKRLSVRESTAADFIIWQASLLMAVCFKVFKGAERVID
jgi:hypothetical protein